MRAWSFVIPQLAHVHAVGIVRLALEPSIPDGGRWLSERELRREAGKSHVPDAAVQLPDDPDTVAGAGLYGEDVDPLPKRVAVEVELTRKGAALAKARMGERPRIDPEQVRQAQPGEAWVIQAGQSIHLRVLPPPAVTVQPVEVAATLPLADDTIPLPVEQPASVGIAAAVALAGRMVRRVGQRMNQRRERNGRLPSPARRPWLPVRPLPGRGRR